MIPILFSKEETKFTSFGLGALVDCVSCTVTEVRDTWEFECEFQYPVSAPMYPLIKVGCIVYVDHDATKDPEPFDIYAYETSLDGITTFHAHHISYRLSKLVMIPQSFEDVNLPRLVNDILVSGYIQWHTTGQQYLRTDIYHFNRSKYGLVDDSVPTDIRVGFWGYIYDQGTDLYNGNFHIPKPISVREAMFGTEGSLFDLFHFEFSFTHWRINVYTKNRGTDRPVSIRYDYNLAALQYEYDTSNTSPALIPYWIDPETNAPFYLDGAEIFDDGTGTVQINTETVAVDGGGTIDVEGTNGFCLMDGAYDAIPLDLSDQFDEQPTPYQLLMAAKEYAKTHFVNQPHESLTVDFVMLQDIPEYELYMDAQQLLLCDTCSVVFPELHLLKKMKVVKTVYDPLANLGAGRYTKLELGSSTRGIFTVTTPTNTEQVEAYTQPHDVDGVIIEEVELGNTTFTDPIYEVPPDDKINDPDIPAEWEYTDD